MEIKLSPGNAGVNASTGKKAGAAQDIGAEAAGAHAKPAEASTVTVTDSGLKMLQIEKTLAEMPGFDADKVDRIKQALSDGSYVINTDRIAEKLISFEQGLS